MAETAIQKILNHFNSRLQKSAEFPENPFAYQRELIQNQEPVIFDIGAHQGKVAITYREYFPSAVIHCFEPFPKSFRKLLMSVEVDSKIFCHKTAISDTKSTVLFNANLDSATNSLLNTDERASSFWGKDVLDTVEQVEINTTSVDAFCLEERISHIDILKIDVQGAEYSVLVGAQNMLENQKISLIYTELITCPTYEGQHTVDDYLSYLDSLGYNLLDVFDPVIRQADNQLLQADILLINSSIYKRSS